MAWIFTYNELMWDFPYPNQMRKKALLEEHHRSFNYLMTDRWGTPSTPAPGLGFETGGDCRGYAYLVPEEEEDDVLENLQKIHGEHFVLKESSIIVDNQSSEEAFFFLSNRSHPDYIGKLVPQEIVKIAQQGAGPCGTGTDWLIYLFEKFLEIGISDLATDAVMSALKWHGIGGDAGRAHGA